MYKNKAITWTIDPVLDAIYEDLRKKHYVKIGHRLYKNYSKDHLSEVSAKTIYWGHSGEPEIVCSILKRPCWPDDTYRILNRLWKPEMLTGPIFDISEGFAKILEDQISWCELRGAKGVFMSREGSGSWQKWANEKLTKMTGIKFHRLHDKFLTCSNESDDSCWQRILYYGDLSVVDQWKNIPSTDKNGVYRLSMEHLDDLKDLVSAKAALKDLVVEDLHHALTYRARWIEGMQKH